MIYTSSESYISLNFNKIYYLNMIVLISVRLMSMSRSLEQRMHLLGPLLYNI
jgi:hypothetical protein